MSGDEKKPSPAKSGLLIAPEELDTPGHRRMFRFAAGLLNWIFDSIYHWQVFGMENIPGKGPLIATINHLSAFDLPALGTAMVNAGWTPGINMFTISKQELFEKPLLPGIMARAGMFPVNRNQSDINAMRTMLSILKRGAMLGVAPEGTRSPTGHLQLFQPGLAKLAIQKRVPILPIGLVGMEKVMPIGSRLPQIVPIQVHFGRVYELSDYYGKDLTPEALERAAWDMRARVAELLPEWMRELPPTDAEVRFGSVLSASEAKSV